MNDLLALSLAQARDKISNKDISALELTNAYIAQSEKNKHLNIYISETYDHARQQAKAIDDKDKNDLGLLAGIPLAIKDIFCTKDVLTTAASKILHNFIPPYESFVTQQLWANNAVMLGKVNLDQFAMGGTNEHSHYGAVINPLRDQTNPNSDLVPGGSSGGSAAAVASYSALASLGTDTGGSVRQPAAFCGVVGMKPTYGRCSRWGIIAFASSLDQAGVFGRDVGDAALLLSAINGHDARDSTSAQQPRQDFHTHISGDIKGLKIGIPKEYMNDSLNSNIADYWQKSADMLKQQGAEIIDVSLPHTKYALACYYIIAPAEASSNLARYDGVRYGLRVAGQDLNDMYANTRAEGFGDEVKRRILIGTYVLSAGYYDAYYLKAQKVRSLIIQDFDNVFQQVDCLLAPVAPNLPHAIGAKSSPIDHYLGDIFTVPASLAGLPAISLPIAQDGNSGLPIAMQLIGKAFDEKTLLNTAKALEEVSDIGFKDFASSLSSGGGA